MSPISQSQFTPLGEVLLLAISAMNSAHKPVTQEALSEHLQTCFPGNPSIIHQPHICVECVISVFVVCFTYIQNTVHILRESNVYPKIHMVFHTYFQKLLWSFQKWIWFSFWYLCLKNVKLSVFCFFQRNLNVYAQVQYIKISWDVVGH